MLAIRIGPMALDRIALQVLVAAVLLMTWSSNMELDPCYSFFDLFAGESNASRVWLLA